MAGTCATLAGAGTDGIAVARASEYTYALQLANRQRAYQRKIDGLHCYADGVHWHMETLVMGCNFVAQAST